MGTVRMGVFSGQGQECARSRRRACLCLLARAPASNGRRSEGRGLRRVLCRPSPSLDCNGWGSCSRSCSNGGSDCSGRRTPTTKDTRAPGRERERERESEVSASMRGRRRPLRLEPGGPVGGRVVSPDVASAPLRSQPKLTHPSRPATRAQPKAGLSYATHNCWLLINTP